ncbi:MAG: hypothetical protein MH132_12865 [Hydrotalea sp.]|nr:hypothetical protein [Hydrotalea sp.]
MKKIHFLITALILILTSCKSEFGPFNEKALAFANNDKRIDEGEYQKLLIEISDSDDRGFQQFKNERGEIDNTKVVSYLVKFFNAKKIGLTANDIWQPETNKNQKGFNINVYLENSGSMNGYLNDPNTEFKNSVYSLLTRLKLFVDKDSLNLFLINKNDQLLYKNASNNDVENFKNILNPASFSKLSKGKTGESDINELIKRCLYNSNDRNLSVFISDCVYSPGKSKPNATMYLAEQKQGIYLNFATEIINRNSDLAVIILQIDAKFKGAYFDKNNKSIDIPNEISRPFYIWFIGSKKQIESILSSKKLEEIDRGYKNMIVFQKPTSDLVTYKILKSQPRIGEFNLEKAATIIKDATPSKDSQNKGKFRFNIAVDFSKSLQDANFFRDTNNYILSNNKYKLSVEIITDKNATSLSGFTHLLKLETSELIEEDLKIEIVGKTPSWVFDSSSIDDSGILIDESQQQKTFGLQYLIEGVSGAFYPKSHANAIHLISITIKK